MGGLFENATALAESNLTVAQLIAVLDGADLATQSDANQIWILIAGFLVFFMHAGFSMLEMGSVQHKSAVNIMFKNVGTVAIGGLCYYLLGYGFAYGTDNADRGSFSFIGVGSFALDGFTNADRHGWFFQYAFAATGATIVSGAVAGRVQLGAYFLIVAFITSLVYPVVSHWIWQAGGWLSAGTDTADVLFQGCGMIDYAGSGVVHMTGGVAAFWGALILGARTGRFAPGMERTFAAHSPSFQTLGTFILWFGWYGFNCGSTLAFDGPNAGKVAVTTTLSPSAAAVMGIILSRVTKGYFDLGMVLNCILGGLAAITAGCSTVGDGSAIAIGAIAALVYTGASWLMKKVKIDDPVDAIAVHGFCGFWGCLAVGLFSTSEYIESAYGKTCDGAGGKQFLTQLVGCMAIIGWVTGMMVPLYLVLKVTKLFRVSVEHEEAGLDASEHGGTSFVKTMGFPEENQV